jgi:hypothetical protein
MGVGNGILGVGGDWVIFDKRARDLIDALERFILE